MAITFSERTETQSLMATLSASECHTPSALITPRRPHCPLRSPAICTITTGTRKVGMHSRCSSALRPSAQFESAWHWRNESKKAPYLPLEETPSACNQHAISMQSACNQHAISMQSACNQYAISMQSVCNQYAISVREVGEEPFGREEELGGGCRRVVWHAECRLRNGDSDQQVHSACTRHAISVQSACNQHAIRMQSADALSVHSACNQRTCETETQSPGLHRCTRGAYCRSGCSCIVLRLAGRTSAVDIRFIHPPSRISCAA